LWSTAWEDAESEVPDFPDDFSASPEELFAELVARYPRLQGCFPIAFESNYMTGVFIPSARAPVAMRWLERTNEALTPLDRRMTKGILRILKEASGKGLAFWEATDLSLPAPAPVTAIAAPASDQIELLNRVSDVRAYDGDVLVFSHRNPKQTTFVDVSTWPPLITNRLSDYARAAARDPSTGVWTLKTATDSHLSPIPFHWMVLPKLSASEPLQGPLEFEKGLEPNQYDSVGIVDGRIVLAPTESGPRNDDIRPAIRGEDGKFHLVSGLPPAEPSNKTIGSRFCKAMGFVRLRDGRDFLIWDGNGYSLSGSKPEMVFHLDAQESTADWSYAPLGEHGFYYLSGRKLFAVRGPGEKPEALLPKLTNIMQLAAGPGDWLIIHEGDNSRDDAAKIYLPAEGVFIHISHEWLGAASTLYAVFSAPAKMFVIVSGKLRGIPLADVEKLQRTNAKTGRKVESR
jgi:hypothetical protein